MNSIVIGFADEAGRTPPQLICGPEVPAREQADVFLKAKREHRFPAGLKRMEWCFFDEERRQVAIEVRPADGRAESGAPEKKARRAK